MKTHLKSKHMNLQSAMEYLMTYGWAILIIAVVLGALFQLGVFNPMTFAPKAPPGACQVFRPNGPGTTQFINLEGVCSGEMPQYVASFSDAQQSIINLGNTIPASLTTTATYIVWVKFQNSPTSGWPWIVGASNLRLYLNPGATMNVSGSATIGTTVYYTAGFLLPSFNTWNQFALVFNGSSTTGHVLNEYMNGIPLPNWAGVTGSLSPTTNDLYIGPEYGIQTVPLNEYISNVQIYNTSLSANEIQALYLEGIGGAPIDLQHLVGWWPLNGNANDYSGNGNNGQINGGLTFVSNWYSGYTPP